MSGVDIRGKDLARVWAVLTAAAPEGAAIYVFGSRANGAAKRGSDLDLAVDAGRPLSRAEAGALADGFEESDLPYRVDVVDMHNVGEAFRGIVERGRVRLPTVEA